MNRKTALTLSLGVLAVVALSAAAATIDSPVSTADGGGGGFGEPPDAGAGFNRSGPGNVSAPPGSVGSSFETPCVPWLASTPVVAGILAVFALLAALIYRTTDSAAVSFALTGVFGAPVYVVHALLTSCRSVAFGGPAGGAGLPNNSSLPPGFGQGTGSTMTGPTALFGMALVGAIGLAALLLVLGTGDDEREPEPPDEEESPDVDVAAIGRAAGEAADRIEGDADVENEVYRAWSEMTDLLDVPNPAASTPAEFASAAVDAGMAREDVDELTDLFEQVRYGGADPTADRERRAVAALRRIEDAYAEEGR